MLDELGLRRRIFAEEVQMVANLKSARLVDAFARVPRERFLRPGPWLIRAEGDMISQGSAPRSTPDADPRHVLHNIVIAIDPARQLFNGLPSMLGSWIDALAPQPGERVLHVGCGLGYYTALMAECVGASGRVLAFEVDEALAAEARANFAAAGYPQVEVRAGNGVELAGDARASFDAILINAGMSHPHDAWLSALRRGGRMMLPLTVPFPQMGPTLGKGITLLITHRRDASGTVDAPDALDARFFNFVAIYSALGIRNDAFTEPLGKAMTKNPWPSIKRLRLDVHEAAASCWLHADGFCISLE
jgi:protein-L-isoaspartate(D-aspartate) O-methyltransferase